MKDLKAIKGRYYIERLVGEGEHECQDFKYAISDARKIARSISAFANNRGGRLLIGVKDNGIIAGIRSEEDVYMIETAASIYCVPSVEVTFQAYKVEPGVVVIKAEIEAFAGRPVCVKEVGGEMKAYYRVNDENVVAPPILLSSWRMIAEQPDFILSDLHSSILQSVSIEGETTIGAIAKKLHISISSAEDAVAIMIASNLLSFRIEKGKFILVAPQKNE